LSISCDTQILAAGHMTTCPH